MKNILLIFLVGLSTSIFSQTDYSVGICNNYNEEILRSQLENCGELTTNCEECNIISFIMTIPNSNSSITEIKTFGKRFNSQMMTAIKKKKPKKIIIEKIIAKMKDGTTISIPSITINIK